jgi:omega-amidase
MKVYCCQLDVVWENKAENFAKVRNLLKTSRPEPGSLFVLPEMFSTGFTMNVAAAATQKNDGTWQFLSEISHELGIYTLAGIVSLDANGRGLNEAVVISPQGDLITRYAKIHPFTLGGEAKNYARGTTIASFEWNGMKVVPFICYDLRFPEVFRTAVREGAEMFVVIAAWPNKRERHWTTLLEARAIENLTYVVGVNRAGTDPQHVYSGRSMIFDYHGRTLADAGSAQGIISAEIDKSAMLQWRKDFPALEDIHWKA